MRNLQIPKMQWELLEILKIEMQGVLVAFFENGIELLVLYR